MRTGILSALSEYLRDGYSHDEQTVIILSNGTIFGTFEEAEEYLKKLNPKNINYTMRSMKSAELLDNMMLSKLSDVIKESKERFGSAQ